MGVRTFDVMNLGRVGLIDPKQMGYKDSIDIIKDESVKIQKSFVKIGWYLKHIRDNELYKEEGYSNIWECAADQLGYSQSTASRFINICEKFSKDHNSPELDEKYVGFDKSQMIEMLPMQEEQLGKVTPDMTVKQIRDIKAEKKGNNDVSQGTGTSEIEVSEEKGTEYISGQTSIEADFPEYLPDSYAVSHGESHSAEDKSELIENSSHGSFLNTDETDQEEEIDKVIEEQYKEVDPQSEPEMQSQPALMVLKNNEQRKEWLNKYRDWGLWYRDEHIDVNYYKYDFEDGSRLVVTEYPERFCYWNGKRQDERYYHLLEKNKKGYKTVYDEVYRHKEDPETYLVEFLKNLQNKRGKIV